MCGGPDHSKKAHCPRSLRSKATAFVQLEKNETHIQWYCPTATQAFNWHVGARILKGMWWQLRTKASRGQKGLQVKPALKCVCVLWLSPTPRKRVCCCPRRADRAVLRSQDRSPDAALTGCAQAWISSFPSSPQAPWWTVTKVAPNHTSYSASFGFRPVGYTGIKMSASQSQLCSQSEHWKEKQLTRSNLMQQALIKALIITDQKCWVINNITSATFAAKSRWSFQWAMWVCVYIGLWRLGSSMLRMPSCENCIHVNSGECQPTVLDAH